MITTNLQIIHHKKYNKRMHGKQINNYTETK